VGGYQLGIDTLAKAMVYSIELSESQNMKGSTVFCHKIAVGGGDHPKNTGGNFRLFL
jgi:hypothetical protein